MQPYFVITRGNEFGKKLCTPVRRLAWYRSLEPQPKARTRIYYPRRNPRPRAMPAPPPAPPEFDLAGATAALQQVVDLHRQHTDDADDDDARARLVSAVREMEWTMQDLEDYGQLAKLDSAALDFQREARTAILEARQALVSSGAAAGHQSDVDVRQHVSPPVSAAHCVSPQPCCWMTLSRQGYETEDDVWRHQSERDIDVSRHTADLHA